VLVLIGNLEHGGSQRQAVELANHLDESRFTVTVCSLSDNVPLAAGLRRKDERLVVVPRQRRLCPRTVWRLARLMRKRNIGVVHDFHSSAEILGRVAARMAGVPAVVASERSCDGERTKFQNLCHHLTQSWFDVIIANSESGKRLHVERLGLPADRVRVVRNGVDSSKFRPSKGLRVRRELRIPAHAPVMGMVAAFQRHKRHEDFFRIARLVRHRFPGARFLCAGEPLREQPRKRDDYHMEIREMVHAEGLAGHCLFLGARDDMPDVYAACDVTVLTSSREGTPNALLESMACGVPAVVTDVSDNAHLVPGSDVGYIVAVGDVEETAHRVCELLADSDRRKDRGRIARDWVVREFSTAGLARRTEAVYLDVLRAKEAARTARRRSPVAD